MQFVLQPVRIEHGTTKVVTDLKKTAPSIYRAWKKQVGGENVKCDFISTTI